MSNVTNFVARHLGHFFVNCAFGYFAILALSAQDTALVLSLAQRLLFQAYLTLLYLELLTKDCVV